MSDNDTSTDTSNQDTVEVEFSSAHFGEEPDTTTETTPEVPETQPEGDAQTPDESTETPTDEPAEQPETAETPEPTEEKPAETKGMTRAERAAFYQQQQQEQQREVAQVVNQTYQPQNVTELQQAYLNEGYSDGEALMLARQDAAEQKALIAEATAEIANLNANLRVDSVEAQSKYDWMNPEKTDSYNKELHEQAAQIFAQGITTDPRTGQIIEARMTPMQAADIVNNIWNSGVGKAQIAAQKAAEQQFADVAPTTSSAPPKSSQTAEDKQAAGIERALNAIR
jgi:hypothetical protein